ncbi:MAG: hypothetical protein HQL33_06605 [Alphaproteobacteria bacterium]|nr:hypothetical protein [Alphaproteobacteria bacterium]
MAADNGLPGVDPEALAGLARQFPKATPTPDPVKAPDPVEAIVEPVSAPSSRQRGRSGGGFAIFLALLALVVAAYPVVLPLVHPWLLAEFGSEPVVQFLLRRAPDTGVRREAVDALAARMEANESVVSGNVGRIAAVESSLTALGHRVEKLTPAVPGDGAAPAKPESMEAWAVSASARIESLEQSLGGAVGRISRLESAFDTTQKRLDAAPPPAAGIPSARMENLETGVAAAVERLAKIETGLGGRVNELAPIVAAATERLAAVEGKAGALEQRLAPVEGKVASVEGQVASVGDRLTQLGDGRESVHRSLRAAQLSLALLQLNAVAQTHKPFAKEIEVVRELSGGDTSIVTQINVIADVAQTGVATVAELRDSFVAIVVPKIQSVAGSDQALTDRVRSWLSNAIAPAGAGTVTPDKDPTEDIIAAAISKLTEDDVAGAVQMLAQLEGPAATLAGRWMTEARARLSINAASETLGGLMLERLGAAAAQP